MYLSMVSTVYFLTLYASATIGSSTSGASVLYKITCPRIEGAGHVYDDRKVENAILAHLSNVQRASLEASVGTTSPQYKAIFKSDERRSWIVDLFQKTYFHSFSPQPWRPEFICIRTQAEAQHYETILRVSNLWRKCTIGRPISGSLYEQKTLLLCPHFFELPDESDGPRRATCPAVRDNMFADNTQRIRFKTSKSSPITAFALKIYSGNSLVHHPPPGEEYVQALNEIIGWDASDAVDYTGSFKLFIHLSKNQCINVPDVDRPPWTGPARLSLESNATNASGNGTLHKPAAQSFGSPGSTLQGIPPDTVDAS